MAWTGDRFEWQSLMHAIWEMPSPTSLSEVADCMGQDLGSNSGVGPCIDWCQPSSCRKWSSAVPRRPKSFMGQSAVVHLLLHVGGSLVAPHCSDCCLVFHSLHFAAVPGDPLCNGRQPQQPMGSNESASHLACTWRREYLAHQWVLCLGLLPRQLHAANWMYSSD